MADSHNHVTASILAYRYIRLAYKEEKRALEEYGDAYRDYMRDVPAWIPNLSNGV